MTEYNRGLVSGLSIQPPHVGSMGGSKIPDFDMTGISGMFTPATRDVENGLWHNAVAGGNDMILTGGSMHGDAVYFGFGEYGRYVCPEPNTVYAVIKVVSNNIVYAYNHYIISKQLADGTGCDIGDECGHGAIDWFNRCYYDEFIEEVINSYGIRGSDDYGNSVIVSDVISDEKYCVYCYTRNEWNYVYAYIDGRVVEPYNNGHFGTGNYGGSMLLNRAEYGDLVIDNTYKNEGVESLGTTCVMMCAFGTEYHDLSTVARNILALESIYNPKLNS